MTRNHAKPNPAARDFERLLSSPWAGPVFLALIHLVIAALAFHHEPFTGGDDATYMALARSLIQRHDYTDIWDPALPPHTQYPPIFPLMLAASLLAGLTPAFGLKVLMVVISTLAVFASCLWLRKVTTAGIAFCAGFFIAISPEIIRLGQEILSDGAFWFFAILALLLWHKADARDSNESRSMPAGWVVAAAAATLAAYFTRSAGAPLLLAIFVWLAMRKQLRAIAVVAAMSAPPIFLWWLRGRAKGAGGYLAPFLSVDPYNPALGNVDATTLLRRVGQNAHLYSSRHLSHLVFGTPRTGVLFGIAFAAAVIYGWSRKARKPGLAEVWLPLYLALVILWPVAWSSPRFLLPVVPLLAFYVGETIAALARSASSPRIFAAAMLLAGVVTVQRELRHQVDIGTHCREAYDLGESYPCTAPVFRDFFTTADRARGKLPPGSVVISRKPTIFFEHSGYQSTLYPLTRKPEPFFALADSVHANYLIIDQIGDLAPKYLHPVMLARRDDFCIVTELSTENAAFAKIEPGGAPRAPGAAPNAFRTCPLVPAK
ncbi:MAG TPA: hypothetical protein VFT21_05960 [Gemmatimonadaceae bacterium]|nr:hypothetical protein [Gemmatimonadaceae bacterium]